ncbi:hypothetical protein P3T76_005126 [Phytophthora citrophthora]|uniref:Uncharacterized protein n=1 Tax=Phytophthora citrophthora TaxID=4793 RepID=A0AAD9LNL0_9STRA|nr:hypothetical protein P3T76_005126 [Phytophthora citrophthora]
MKFAAIAVVTALATSSVVAFDSPALRALAEDTAANGGLEANAESPNDGDKEMWGWGGRPGWGWGRPGWGWGHHHRGWGWGRPGWGW